ncbi:MAG: hypothetical protein IMZ43_09565 [Thermoplasmata archaeon]|nr:hypothetical protein [Thermoplasmata archaeon]
MRAKIVEIGPRDGYHLRSDLNLIGKEGEWEWESGPIGDWESGWMHFDEPILDWACWYFIQVKVALPPAIEEDIGMGTRHGHPDFYRLCEEEMDLHSRKNHDYAAGGNPLGNFNRVSAILAMYPGLKPSDPAVVAITYLMKQLDASLWMLSNGHTAQVEGQKERWQDISVYSKIISILISEGGKDVKNN